MQPPLQDNSFHLSFDSIHLLSLSHTRSLFFFISTRRVKIAYHVFVETSVRSVQGGGQGGHASWNRILDWYALSLMLRYDIYLSDTTADNELVRTSTGHHENQEQHIHLQPEPSADPSDPLNFSMTRKVTILILMSAYALLGNLSSAILSSALPDLVTAFATFPAHGPPTGLVPFGTLVQLIALSSFMVGAGNILAVPLGNTYGRRPVILGCLLILTVMSIWCAKATSFKSLLAGRVLQGLGACASDTLAPAVIGEIFFTHQRGRGMAVYTICLTGGSLLGGIIGGYIAGTLGWRWTMWLAVILSGALFTGCLFFLPETMFDREAAMRAVSPDHGEIDSTTNEKAGVNAIERVHTLGRVNSQVFPPFTFVRSLGFAKPRPGLWPRFWRPWLTLRYPGVIMVSLQYAGLVGLIVTISTVAPTLLAAPPYSWGNNVGLISVGGLIGCTLGGLYTYFTTDWLTKRAAKRELHGLAEPEKRLPLMFPSIFIATGGALIFGFVGNNPSPNGWVGLGFGYGMVAFGLMQIPSIGFNYLIEAYGEHASDCCKSSKIKVFSSYQSH